MNPQPSGIPKLILTERFSHAFDYARRLHTETRKRTAVPYLAHLLGVASLVMGEHGYVDFPVTEDMVIAALLHDAAEDHGGEKRLADITVHFGADVARMVEGLSDSLVDEGAPKAPWAERKYGYLQRLRDEPPQVKLISVADKLYNARSLLADFLVEGPSIWQRFQRTQEDQLRYFRALLAEFERSGSNRLVREYARVLFELESTLLRAARPTSGAAE
ncbi:MAG TPA: HD domain-containing protein [Candidatus Acidoferrales bacterium]|nr:HD domain-containing protein [Candidatus Acidoferrales bacterium]